jgi:Leucine-rich repeat (LRR) protein
MATERIELSLEADMKSQEMTVLCFGFLILLVAGVFGYRQLSRNFKDQNDELRKVSLLIEMDASRRAKDLEVVKLQNAQVMQKLKDDADLAQKRTDALQDELIELGSQMPLAKGESAEDRAVAVIERLGARAVRDDKLPNRPVVAATFDFKILSPATFRQIKQLKELRSLSLTRCRVSESGLALLAELPRLESLDLSNSELTGTGLTALKCFKQLRKLSLQFALIEANGFSQLKDCNQLEALDLTGLRGLAGKGLAPVAGLTRLKYLDLSVTDVTDDGLAALEKLDDLEELFLRKTLITSAGLAHIKGLKQLRTLDLDETPTRDDGLKNLKGLTKMRRLLLNFTQITDAGLANLRDLKELQVLGLRATLVGDAGLENLKDLKDLSRLGLEHTNVTDAGMVYLQDLPRLRELRVEETSVTAAGLSKLKGLEKAP